MIARIEVDMTQLFIGKTNVRHELGDITELIDSVKVHKGVIQPLVVRRATGNRFEVIVGGRRFEALKASGYRKAPVLIRQASDEDGIVLSLAENLQRKNLSLEDEYAAYLELQRLNPKRFSTHKKIAEELGKSESHVQEVFEAIGLATKMREAKAKVQVDSAPSEEERAAGTLPLEHGRLLSQASRAETLKRLPEEQRTQQLTQLHEAIVGLPRDKASQVVQEFKKEPEKPIKQIVEGVAGFKFQIYLPFKLASALKKASDEKHVKEEQLIVTALEDWLEQGKYL